MRMGLAQALHHARHRSVFQKHLADQPLMRSVLADLALELEGAVALVMRLACAFDRAAKDSSEAAYARLLTPAVKYMICKTAPALIYEAMECLGGNGYVEESLLPRLYREAPVNAIWEGSGNVMCLDVLRALSREGEAARTVLGTLAQAAKGLPGVEETIAFVDQVLKSADAEAHARAAVERIAVLAALVTLRDSAPAEVTELFARTRLAERHGATYGAVALDGRAAAALLERALPEGSAFRTF
jgi:putative acyl-CoA dehydrogenase